MNFLSNKKIRIENIIVLSYKPNSDRIKFDLFFETRNEDLKVDLEKNTWTYRSWENLKIGTNRPIISEERKGIIGVYDRNNLNHHTAWNEAAIEAIGEMAPREI